MNNNLLVKKLVHTLNAYVSKKKFLFLKYILKYDFDLEIFKCNMLDQRKFYLNFLFIKCEAYILFAIGRF